MSGLRILISGAGIAGPTLAFFLAKAGAHVTIVERSPTLRTGGQNVDIRGHGWTVIQRMGLEDQILSKVTNEKGLRFVDANDVCQAEFPVDDGKGFTSEVEIMRGDLACIFYEATKNETEYIFGEQISGVEERGSEVHIQFANGTPSREYDVLIAADGWASKTRALAFGEAQNDAIKPLGQWSSWFTIPWKESDNDWARWYNATLGRMILIRPDSQQVTRVSLWLMSSDEKIEAALSTPISEQKALMRQLFSGAGWEAERVLEGMDQSDDFYIQKVAQVRLDTWSKGRTVLVGDSAFCPSPISGMGTTVALVGAYVLASEIAKSPSDLDSAFHAYEKRMRPYVGVAQKLMPGAPGMANPQTRWGIWFMHRILWFVARTGLHKHMGASVNPPASAFEMPDYN